MTITVHRKQVVNVLIMIALAVIFLSLLTVISTCVFQRGRLLGLIPMFSMDREANVPTLLAVLLLFAAAGLIYLLSRQLTASADRFSRHVTRLSYIFIFMAVDEFTSIHELFINPLGALTPKTGIFHYSWIIVGIPVVIIVGLYYLKFFLAQRRSSRSGSLLQGSSSYSVRSVWRWSEAASPLPTGSLTSATDWLLWSKRAVRSSV